MLQALVAVGAIEGAQSGLVPRGVGVARVREVEGDGREWGRVGGGAERGVALARHLEHAPGGVQRHHAAGAVGGADLAGEDVRARAGAGGEVEHHVLGRGEAQLHQRLHPRDEHLSPRALVVPPGVVRREPAGVEEDALENPRRVPTSTGPPTVTRDVCGSGTRRADATRSARTERRARRDIADDRRRARRSAPRPPRRRAVPSTTGGIHIVAVSSRRST